MNILIPHQWLLDHLDTEATPEQIQKYLSLCGPSVERIHILEGKPVYDIEVTTNRVDCMSVRGIAREAAAILPEFKIKAILKPSPVLADVSHKPLNLKIVNDPKLCHRILAIKLENIKIAPSPKWLEKRLLQVGQRPLNNVIDITNYVMWELGHPLHAFDYDRLNPKTIIVRQAKKGEQLITLDHKIHILQGGEVVFDNGQNTIIDLPGIMGTTNTVVTSKTKNVLLWIESVTPHLIRQASMALAIRSQAAVLNEKSVDPERGEEAILHAAYLMQQLYQAKIASRLIDIYPTRVKPKSVTLTQNQIDTYLGLSLKPTRTTHILQNLGCTIRTTSNSYTVTPPSWRSHDLQIPEDYIEEIARIYGYHNLPSVVMPTPIPDCEAQDNFQLEQTLKTWLADLGLTEIYSYSLVSKNIAEQSGIPLKNHLKLKNPLTDDLVYLRRSLVPSHLQVIDQNKSRGQVSVFEMANVYIPHSKDLPTEELHLTLTTTKDYHFLKGILDTLASKLHLDNYSVTPKGIVMANNIPLGTINHSQTAFVCDLLVKPLLNISSTHPRYIPVTTHPPIIEDLTFILPPKTHLGPVISAIKAVSPLIETVSLKDIFQHNHTFTVSYRSSQRSLTDQEITPLRKLIVNALQKTFSTKLVGKI